MNHDVNRSFLSKFLSKFFSFFILTSVVFCASHAEARSRYAGAAGNFALGLGLGEPSGPSAKYWVHSDQAVDMMLAYNFDSHLYLIGDYKKHFPWLFQKFVAGAEAVPYLGLGFSLGFEGNRSKSFSLGLRVPFGFEWIFAQGRFGVFFEIAPGIGLVPSTDGLLQGAIGMRYYF